MLGPAPVIYLYGFAERHLLIPVSCPPQSCAITLLKRVSVTTRQPFSSTEHRGRRRSQDPPSH